VSLPAGEVKGPYDLVVIGGGYSGMGAALSAARLGLKVALVQDRPVLGGNGSSEVRVWAMGLIRRGKYPRIGEIVEEFADKATKSPGTYEEFEDEKKERVIRAEPTIDLFLNTHAFAVARDGNRIESVSALDTRTSRELEFTGSFFCDATGHATIGHLAGAETVMEPKGRMGMSNMWAWANRDTPQAFPIPRSRAHLCRARAAVGGLGRGGLVRARRAWAASIAAHGRGSRGRAARSGAEASARGDGDRRGVAGRGGWPGCGRGERRPRRHGPEDEPGR
jgi:hypothetical protein